MLFLAVMLAAMWVRWEMRMSEVVEKIEAVGATLDKVFGEVSGLVTKVSDLEAALAAAQVEDPAVAEALAALKDKADAIDALNPDPVEEPAE